MKTFILNYSCIIDAATLDVYQFHTDTNNLPLITPPWIDVEILRMDNPMKEGSVVELKIKRFGLPSIWKMQIEKQLCPQTVVDKMLIGPFKSFRHERVFTAITDTQTRMDECISLVLPLGMLGAMAFPIVKMDMDKMFGFRHSATKRYFEVKDK